MVSIYVCYTHHILDKLNKLLVLFQVQGLKRQ